MERLVRTLFVFYILSFTSLSLWAAEAKTPAGQPVGSASFNDMLGKQIKPGTLSIEEQPDGSFLLTNKLQTLSAHITPSAINFGSIGKNAGKGSFAMKFDKWGREYFLQKVSSVSLHKKDEVVYHTYTNDLVEQFTNKIDGIQQDFVLSKKLDGRGELHLQLLVSNAQLEQQSAGVTLLLNSGRKLTYGHLEVKDSTGKMIPSEAHVLAKNRIDLVINDSTAQYPITIDPTLSDSNWLSLSSGYDGTNGVVNAIAIDAGNIYVGGSFSIAGAIFANNIAMWDGSSWNNLAGGVLACSTCSPATVNAIVVDKTGNVFVGGQFAQAGGVAASNIAVWNGSGWAALGQGVYCDPNRPCNPIVNALAMDTLGNLYAGGTFTTASGVSCTTSLAKWNGGNWSRIDVSSWIPPIQALAIDSNNNIYIGGAFTDGIEVWNGTVWSPLGGGLINHNNGSYTTPSVNAIGIDTNGNVYVGGTFTGSNNVQMYNFGKWNGAQWETMGPGFGVPVQSIMVDSTGVVYVGVCGAINGVNVCAPLYWNGTTWKQYTKDVVGADSLNTMAMDSNRNIYAGGMIFAPNSYISMWNGSAWVGLDGPGNNPGSSAGAGYSIPPQITAFTIGTDGNMYFGYHGFGNYLLEWDGSNWIALGGTNFSWPIYSIAMDSKQNVYFSFGEYNGQNYTGVYEWDGKSFKSLKGGDKNLAIDSNDNIFTAGMADYVSVWNGKNWLTLPGTLTQIVNGPVNTTLALDSHNNLYIGGLFSSINGVAANSVAKWDGSQWSALTSGLNGRVNTIAIDQNDRVYIGGSFTSAGGISAYNIAEWNGASWVSPGYLQSSSINVLALDSAQNIYAGGYDSNGHPLIAMWDGTSWDSLGSGISSACNMNSLIPCISALEADYAGDVFVTGNFSTAGQLVSANFAKWSPTPLIPGSYSSYRFYGRQPSAEFGNALALADMDGDGFADILVGAPLAPVFSLGVSVKSVGIVETISGKTGAAIHDSTGKSAGQEFGSAVAIVPDQDGDGIQDLVIGFPNASIQKNINGDLKTLAAAGIVSLYSGATGAFIRTLVTGSAAGERCGAAVAAGDVTNSGNIDLVVGSPGVSKGAGMVAVYSGLGFSTIYQRYGDIAGENFGASVAIDINTHQLLVGSPKYSLISPKKIPSVGRVQIFDGTNGLSPNILSVTGAVSGEAFGTSVASFCQDLDLDGQDEWAAGAPGANSSQALKVGTVRIYSGTTSNIPTHHIDGSITSGRFGASIASCADINKDGKNDLVIGIPYASAKSYPQGKYALLTKAGYVEFVSSSAIFH